METIRIATFDIETTHLHADFGIILCAVVAESAAKSHPTVLRGDVENRKWATDRANDSAVVAKLAQTLANYDILIAHNGVKFDIPFLRTRLARWKLPPLPDIKILDPVQLARSKFRFSYNSLDKIAAFLDVNEKTPVRGDMWVRAALNGDREAMDYIVRHCIADVATLERIVDAVKHYSTVINSWGSGR